MIKKITGLNAQHVLDPTMLFNAEHYRKMAKRPLFEIPEHYALIYLSLDGFPLSKQREYKQIVKLE